MADPRDLDIVVFGATGFTGGLVADYLAAHGGPLRWALAGRDAGKLAAVQQRLSGHGSAPTIIVADASDRAALDAMAKRTKVVLTTVGPYIRYGEALVAACADNGTHYVDLTGEPPFVARTRERYHARAVQTGAKIVHACGFDSIPHDLGAYFTLLALRKRLSPAERDSTPIAITGVVRAGGTFSGGTWHSALAVMGDMRHELAQRRPKPQRTGNRRVGALPLRIRHDRALDLWLVPMPTIDPLVVMESARAMPVYGPDFRYGHFLGLRTLAQVAGLGLGVGTVFALAQLPPTRALLGKLKEPGEGPDEATRKKGWFRVAFEGKAGSTTVHCEVRGGDPGYGETAKMIAESALCLAFDDARLPEASGVITTAIACGDALIARLEAAGIQFAEV